MVNPEVLVKDFGAAPDVLWKQLLSALATVDGATLVAANHDGKELRFMTGVTATSWGENMTATVLPSGNGSTLRIMGQVRHTFMTTSWGEKVHRRGFVRNLLALLPADVQ